MGLLLVAVVLFFSWTSPASAQDLDLSVRQAVERALASHPLLDSAARRIEVSEAFRTQASLAPNPRFILQHENARPGSVRNPYVHYRDSDQFAYLQQTLETSGKRGLRTALAETGIQRAGVERELTRQLIAARVGVAYWTALGARRLHALLVETAQNLQRVVEYHEVRVKEGAMAEADLLRVRLEVQRLNVSINHALLASERARIHLFREMGQREFPPVRYTDTVEDALSAALNAELATALANRVELKLARQQADQARAQQSLQTALAKPNVDLVFGYKRTAGFNTVIGGVQWDLPFRNRNQGSIAAASAEIRVAEANLAAAEALVGAEFAAAHSAYQLHRNDVTTFLEPLQRQAEETYRIAEAAYREGGADLLRLLDAQRVRIESRIAYIEGLTEVREAEAELRAAMGVLP